MTSIIHEKSPIEDLIHHLTVLVGQAEEDRPSPDAAGFSRNYAIGVTHLEDALLRFVHAADMREQSQERTEAS